MVADIFQMKEKRSSSFIDDVENRKNSQNWKRASVPVREEQEDRFFFYQTAVMFLGCLFALEPKYSLKWEKL